MVVLLLFCGMRRRVHVATARALSTWQEGKCIVFDDSWEHEAYNKGAPRPPFCLAASAFPS